MISTPLNQDIDVYKDRDFKLVFNLKDGSSKPINISGWTIVAQIRPTYGSDILVANFNISTTAASGIINMTLDYTTTSGIASTNPIAFGSTKTSSNMVWDMVVVDDIGDRYSLLSGKCTIHETVSRD